jgi:hypothetical protein
VWSSPLLKVRRLRQRGKRAAPHDCRFIGQCRRLSLFPARVSFYPINCLLEIEYLMILEGLGVPSFGFGYLMMPVLRKEKEMQLEGESEALGLMLVMYGNVSSHLPHPVGRWIFRSVFPTATSPFCLATATSGTLPSTYTCTEG